MMTKISKREITTSYGIVVVRFENGVPLFLLLKVYNFVEPPKGRAELNENPIDAAIRETYEEASILPEELNFKWGRDSFTTDVYKKGSKVNVFFLAETNKKDIVLPINPEIGKAEHDGFIWADYKKAKKITNERIGKVIDWAYNKITKE